MEATDFSKAFLFFVLMLVVFVLVVGGKKRPLASSPLEPTTSTDESQTADDQSMITRGPGFANQLTYDQVPPLSLVMPTTGVQPLGECE